MADRQLVTEVKVINLQPGLARNLKANLKKISFISVARNLDLLSTNVKMFIGQFLKFLARFLHVK